MFEIVSNEIIVPNLHLLTVRAPGIAEAVRPGQFVIVRDSDDGERIPLSVADWDSEAGTLSIIFMVVGASTTRLARKPAGSSIPTVVGPLGKPTEIDAFGTVVCIGGCYGIGSIYPIVRALHKKGNHVITFIEARSRNLLYWEDKLKTYSHRLTAITRDGSYGERGHIKRGAEILREGNIVPDRVIANGCTFSVYKASREFSHFDVPVMVALNTIMIDGTGMCGVCRLTVDGKTKFACVDGPDFDGRLVNWEELSQRRKQYIDEEAFLVHGSGCGGI